MKYSHKGSVVPLLVAIIAILVVVIGFGIYRYEKDTVHVAVAPDVQQSDAMPQINVKAAPPSRAPSVSNAPSQLPIVNNQALPGTQSSCVSTSPAAITITSPASSAVFSAGQRVTITWASCNVDKVFIGWAQGGHDKGFFSETPVPASGGSYQWTVPGYPGIVGGDYWIHVDQAVPQPNNTWTSGVYGKSGSFSIQ